MGSPLKSIYQTSPLQSIYPTRKPISTRMKPILVLLLSVLSLSHGDPIGNPVNDPVDDAVNDPLDDPANDPMDNPVDDPMDDPVDDPMDDPMDDTMDDPMGDPEDNLGDDLPDVEELEMQAFEQCESDGEEGLTWDEVEACEIFILPTEEDFQASDLNKDGILLFKEWKEWMDMDMDMVDDE